MSDKMLYNEAKAEQKFQTLMNAAVSHELRNPLSALVGGIQTMKAYLENILVVIETLQQHSHDPIIKLVLEKLILIQEGLNKNLIKMNNSANLIDYFVHDMLDYTILSNNVENFMKDNHHFDLLECINQIYEMLEDKINLKLI